MKSSSQLAKREVAALGSQKVEEARQLLARCVKVDEAKNIRDQAAAIQAYYRQQRAGRAAQNDAAEIKLRAERRLGELLQPEKEKRGGAKSQRVTLPADVTRKQSSRWQEVARVPEPKFEAYVREQREDPTGEITTAGLSREARQEAKGHKRASQVKKAKAYVPPAGEYAVIAADPPWPFEDKLEGVDRELPYPTMTVEEICAFKVPAAKDCALFLWTTNAHLIDGSALKVLKAWGFEPKALLTWVKPKIGLGRYLRNRTEQCVIAVKGSVVFEPGAISNVLEASAGKHSEKPQAFFDLVEKVCPATSRLELFARQVRPGWVTSGSEAPATKKGKAATTVDADGQEASRCADPSCNLVVKKAGDLCQRHAKANKNAASEVSENFKFRLEHAPAAQCYVCWRKFERTSGDGGTTDYIGVAHNRCLTALSPADSKARNRWHTQLGEFFPKIDCDTSRRLGKRCSSTLPNGELCWLKPGHPGGHRDELGSIRWEDDVSDEPALCAVGDCPNPREVADLCKAHRKIADQRIAEAKKSDAFVDDGRRCGLMSGADACRLDQGHAGEHHGAKRSWANKEATAISVTANGKPRRMPIQEEA